MADPRLPAVNTELLKRTRLRQGLSLRRLGELSGVDHSNISAYERGLHRPRPDTLLALARALGYPDADPLLLHAA
jgi:transcriptional regulator with XRE-family HTH domain